MNTEPLFDHLVGSCNGLVCAYQIHNLVLDPIYICNPLTGEYVYLAGLVVKKEDIDPARMQRGEVNMYYHLACGFGYVRSTNEYKVVRIHYVGYSEGNVQVYTLGSGCGWRAIGKISYRLDTSRKGTGTNADDAIYWISETTIVTFGLADEEFRVLSSVPPCLPNRKVQDGCGLVALGRHLCLYLDKMRMEIWYLMMKGSDSETVIFEDDFQLIFNRLSGRCRSNCSREYLWEKIQRGVSTPLDDVIDQLDRVALVHEEIDTTPFRLGDH